MSEKNTEIDGDPIARTNPFFLVGCVRSGTTLLRLLLGHHPSICQCEEFDFSVEFSEDNTIPPGLPEFHDYLGKHRGFRFSGYDIDKALDYHALMKSFLHQRQALDARPVVGATVHSNFSQLINIWLDAKFIHIRRDPRDVARSIVQQGWAGTTWHGTLRWNQAERSWEQLKSKISPDQWVEVRYEDLIEDSVGTLTFNLGHLGLSYVPEMLEIEKDTTYSRPNPKEAQHWSKTASREDVQLVEVCAQDLLTKAGYAQSEFPTLPLSGLKRLQLNMQDRFNNVRFFVDKFGLSLWLLRLVSRRLPFEGFRAGIQFRIDEETNQYLK